MPPSPVSPEFSQLLRQLSGTSSLSERLAGLLSLGLTVPELADAAATSPQTIKNWLRGGRATKGERAIDSLRLAVVIGLDRGYTPEAIRNWLKSANPHLEGFGVPLKLVASNRIEVIQALTMESSPVEMAAEFVSGSGHQ